MHTILRNKSFVCYNCLNQLNVLKRLELNITTKTPKIETKISRKTRTKLELSAKKFPRLLKDLEKFNKNLSQNKKTVIESVEKSSDNVSNDLQNQEMEIKEYFESVPNDYFTNHFDKQIEDIFELTDQQFNQFSIIPEEVTQELSKQNDKQLDKKENKSRKTGSTDKLKTKQPKVTKPSEELRNHLRQIDLMSKSSNLRSSLKSYIYSCIYADLLTKAHSVFLHYRYKTIKNKVFSEDNNPIDVSVYNVLMKGWAQRGKTFRVKELFNLMNEINIKPNSESFVYYFLSMSRQLNEPTNEEILQILQQIIKNELKVDQMFDNCFLSVEEKNSILKLINKSMNWFKVQKISFPDQYSSKLMEPIVRLEQKYFNPIEGINLEGLEASAKQQFSLEINGNMKIKSIISDQMIGVTESYKKFLQNQWKSVETQWKDSLKESFLRRLKNLQIQSNEIKGMTLYPYLTVLDTQYYIDAIIEEIKLRANTSEYYSPPLSILHHALGQKVMIRYLVKTHIRDGTAQDFQQIYDKYLEYYKNSDLTTKYNPREYWHKLLVDSQHFYKDNSNDKVWPYHVVIGVGQFLYDLMVQEIKFDVNIMKSVPNLKAKPVLAFGITYKSIGNLKYQKEFRAHPLLIKLFRKACSDTLLFDMNLLPMLCPPTPWISPNFGGYLLTQTNFVRLSETGKWVYNNYSSQSLYPVFDSLNYLSMIPWILNERVLDVAISVFINNGNQKLSIPKPSTEFPPLIKINQGLPKNDKIEAFRRRKQQKREMAEMFSLWCDCLYKLSIANHFRNKLFWFPNNLDFRGRVYPVPPHFNHLGCDLTRSLMLFAKGQPLGENGLNWLKIHLINLTGLKKRCSLDERLAFANEILPLIMDSADNPLDGCKWWIESDDPWQTLACAIEITKAVRSPDHTKYICHFPVHQDGSCNGLQHYAALGRDQSGAESVNLFPSDRPKDVYSDVAALVEQQRAKDAINGLEMAKLLEGHIERKIVKQTVMTYVYGVTRFGAKLQIFKRLKESDTFPKEKAFAASIYLTNSTFASIQQMFTQTRDIQDWLTECATIVSKVYEKPVEWVTPLGFPVLQHYHKAKSIIGETFLGIGTEPNLTYMSRFDIFHKPNTLKQKNAFPPNFIHSLDSTHMMLTSLNCQKEGLTFASVHDCFWTHPNCVQLMNQICRQQFVSLHNEPILDDLAKHFIQIYCQTLPSNANQNEIKRYQKILGRKIEKGLFDLNNLFNSVYFFS